MRLHRAEVYGICNLRIPSAPECAANIGTTLQRHNGKSAGGIWEAVLSGKGTRATIVAEHSNCSP